MSKVNKMLAVIHRSHINPKTQLVELYGAKVKLRKIVMEYTDGRVKDSAGDTWEVKQSGAYQEAQYITVR